MKVVSIDIETTGINPDTCQIVQFGAVLFDTETKEFLPKFYSKIIIQDEYHGEEFALNMNKHIIAAAQAYKLNPIDELKNEFIHIDDLAKDFRKWLNKTYAFDSEKSINIAGKNVMGFDMQFLLKLEDFAKIVPFKRRTLDPAILLYLPNDKFLPDLNGCIKRTFGSLVNKDTQHFGDADALDVAAVLWTKLGTNHSNAAIIRCARKVEKLSNDIAQNFANICTTLNVKL